MHPGEPITVTHQVVTLQDIAARCGVTKLTVSRALLNDPRVKAGTRARILTAAQEMGYHPGKMPAARRLALRADGRDILNHNIAVSIRADMYTVNYNSLMFKGLVEEAGQTRLFAVASAGAEQ